MTEYKPDETALPLPPWSRYSDETMGQAGRYGRLPLGGARPAGAASSPG